MRIGVFISPPTLDDYVAEARRAVEAGLDSVWTPQIFSYDALTALAVVGREVSGIDLGTSVIPTYPRHPMMLAPQALTTQAACGGRLTLGIGLSHQVVIENMFGYSFDRPARHMREYLSALMPLLRDRRVSFEGETVKAMGQLQFPDVPPPPVLVAALGPAMLQLTGELADGTVTWMVGPTTLGDHIVPSISKSAAEAGREAPRVVCALPVAVTDDVTQARERAGNAFAMYNGLPSYRAMLDREGAEGPSDVAVIGDEASVRSQIEGIFERGATEFVAVPFAERDRTWEFLSSR